MDITYGDIANAFRDKARNCCDNIVRYSNIADEKVFTLGYTSPAEPTPHTYPTQITLSGTLQYQPYHQFYVSAQGVTSASASDFNTMFNYFVEATGVVLTNYCTVSGMYYLLENLVKFCTSNMYFSTSLYSASRYLVYKNPVYRDANNVVLSRKADIVNAMKTQVIKNVHTTDIKDNYVRKEILFEALEKYISSIKQQVRTVPVIYYFICN